MTDEPVLEMRGITKRFPGIVANDDVGLDVRKGEVHALLGENGAGKSTLMNILYGLYKPDEGEIRLQGQPGRHSGRRRTRSKPGIGMVHQHFMLIPVMTVAENIVLGIEPVREGVLLDERGAEERVRELSKQYGLVVDPAALDRRHHRRPAAARRDPQGALPRRGDPHPRRADGGAHAAGGDGALRDRPQPPGRRQVDHLHQPQAERGARDRRPHHGPAAREEDRDGAARGSDRGVARASDGRARRAAARREAAGRAGRRRCSRSSDLTCSTTAASRRCAASRSTVRAGEIVGIAGVDGNGQTELVDAIAGLRKSESGHDPGRRPARSSTRARGEMLDAGLGHIPEDRQRRGLVLEFTIAENIALHDYAEPPDAKWGWLFPTRLVERARTLIKEFDVRGGGPLTRAGGALRRQPAEGRRRARDRARPEGADRGAADARPRRRRDRVPAPAARRGARRGARDPARLARARRDSVALRPHPRASTKARSSASTVQTCPRRRSVSRCSAAGGRPREPTPRAGPARDARGGRGDRHARRRASRCASARAGSSCRCSRR